MRKSSGYGTENDPLANFTLLGQLKRQPGYVYALDRLTEKAIRCHSLLAQGRHAELGEEFVDMASLALCAEAIRREPTYAVGDVSGR